MPNDLEQRVAALEALIQSMQHLHTAPQDFRKALTDAGLSVSSKGASTEDQAVNEGGAAAYAVMGDPDGFLQVTIAGTIYYVPYFS